MSSPTQTMTDLGLIEDPAADTQPQTHWRVLVVDDDPEIHAVTRLALDGCAFDGQPIDVLSAHSIAEARHVLEKYRDIALILLDVVMETEHAGLDLVRHVREERGNRAVRIVLRTGQPGQAPAREVVARYEIDDYRTKTELTYERLYILVITALRTFRLLRQLETHGLELRQSNEDLERFAYVASHDLQTPLRGIIGFSQLLKKRYGKTLDDDGRQLLDDVLQSGRDLQTLISDLLEFSRLGRQKTAPISVDLNEVVRGACVKLRGMLEERGAVVECGQLPIVPGNASQLEQLFRNLIDNGIKFQPGQRPTVKVSATTIETGWEIRVADQGIGVEEEYLEHIFEPFRRLHTSDRFPGSGIGLAICKKVVQLHGGSIRAESKSGEGTTFVIELPTKAP